MGAHVKMPRGLFTLISTSVPIAVLRLPQWTICRCCCGSCRFDPENAAGIQDTIPLPSLGFYNRVRYRIVEKQQKEAWGLFSPGAAFFRRIAFASLLLLAGLGSFLVSRESSFSGTDAASIMAQHDPVAAHSESSDRDRMLVTLATWRE